MLLRDANKNLIMKRCKGIFINRTLRVFWRFWFLLPEFLTPKNQQTILCVVANHKELKCRLNFRSTYVEIDIKTQHTLVLFGTSQLCLN